MEQLGEQFGAQSGLKSAQGQAVGKNMDAFSFTDVVRFPPSALRLAIRNPSQYYSSCDSCGSAGKRVGI
jgi:hypothetical protein